MEIRPERPEDRLAIRQVTEAAFRGAAHSDGSEGRIIDALRAAEALVVSLVAAEDSAIIGHAAFSSIFIKDGPSDWFGLGPLAVRPDRQGRGVGRALIFAGLARLAELGAAGCVVFGDPSYYGRFGFVCDPALAYAGAPPGYFQRRIIQGPAPKGEVLYHPAFSAA